LISVGISQLALLFKLFIALFVLLHTFKHWCKSEPVWSLRWNLDEGELHLAKDSEPYQECIGIRQLYLVFGMLHLQIEQQPKKYINLLIFPDSVDRQSFRRLRVAARWGSIKVKPD
jgi:hypothetical protein